MEKIRRRLEGDLRALERELRQELPKEIQRARELGDLRENAEYKAALERQSFVRSRIGQIRQRLEKLSLMKVDSLPTDRAHLGSRLTVLDLKTQEETIYELVIAEDADPANGRISIASPIGRSLVGKEEGDEVKVRIPSGTRTLEVRSLRTAHDLLEENENQGE
ncbi:MAG: GreA/GreB family elongation factor [Acidobacteriota bacterium]